MKTSKPLVSKGETGRSLGWFPSIVASIGNFTFVTTATAREGTSSGLIFSGVGLPMIPISCAQES